ncbi:MULTISPECIES: rolling circle replication-associated protein [Comamonas]|uniref:rolling circle replication-associated protein n=1 Tax=Comamonas TaxID=283 RepID=UPI000A4670A3|nr:MULTISPECIES: hypothetical protein [Comamonas]
MHQRNEIDKQQSCSELVNKIERSATALKKRLRTTKKILKEVFFQHRRIAKSEGLFAVAATLTYRSENEFHSKNISQFIEKLRKKFKRRGHALRYSWALERKDQLLHYHLMVWIPRNLHISWADIVAGWTFGSTWIKQCTSPYAWATYMGKSATKENLPRSAKSYGYGGLDHDGKDSLKQSKMPSWLKDLKPIFSNMKKIPHLGWCDVLTGELYRSPWIWGPKGWARNPENQTRVGDASCLEQP